MTEEQKKLLKQKINLLATANYNSGCADESPQQNWTQQKRWDLKSKEAQEDLYSFIDQCLSTPT